jgi:hypothetical protein
MSTDYMVHIYVQDGKFITHKVRQVTKYVRIWGEKTNKPF